MNHQILINICIFEQSEELLFSDLSVPLNRATHLRVLFMVRIFCSIKLFTIFKIWHQFKKCESLKFITKIGNVLIFINLFCKTET